ncbi:MAG: carbohydrate kinase [Spirochaetaceae bacterium]|nr:MAG: carbohydrate kinase [Spirochaetaceae bacterium]
MGHGVSEPRVLGIDIGTSAIKAGCITPDGTLVSSSGERIIGYPSQIHDWDAEAWSQTLSRLLSRLPERDQISAVVVSGNGPTVVAMNKAGQALQPTLLWLDPRENRVPDTESYFLPKASWLYKHIPLLRQKVKYFIGCPEFLSFQLTGEAVTTTPGEEFSTYIWTPEEIRAYDLNPALFPPFVQPGEFVGRVLPQAAVQFGLPERIPVFAGGSDFLMSLIGTATLQPGRTCDRAGTSEGINYCSAEKVHDSRLRCLPHAVDGFYNIAGILSSTGRLFEWFREISGQSNTRYDTMLEEIRAIAHTSSYPWFFPSIKHGATWEFSRGMFVELGAEHGPAEMGRAVVESIGFAVRESMEILEENNCPIDTVCGCGGQAKNSIWTQMKADICGKVIEVPVIQDAELAGCAAAGFVGLGHYTSLPAAAENIVKIHARYEPRPEEYERYTERYNRYREVYSRFRSAASDVLQGRSDSH